MHPPVVTAEKTPYIGDQRIDPEHIRSIMLPLQQQVIAACQGWTVAISSPNHEFIAMASLLFPQSSLAAATVADLIAGLPAAMDRLLVICDDDQPDGGALLLMQQVRHVLPQSVCRFMVVLPGSVSQARLRQLLDGGADALYCLESSGTGVGLQALMQALKGQQSVDAHFRRRLQSGQDSEVQRQQPQLSESEEELILLLARGHNGPQIAALRQRRCDTIRRQFSAIYRKIGVRDHCGLMAWALANGVIRPLDLVQPRMSEGVPRPS